MKPQKHTQNQENSNIIPFQSREQKKEAAEAAKFSIVPDRQLFIAITVHRNRDVIPLYRYAVEEFGVSYAKLLYGLKDLCLRKPGTDPKEQVWIQICDGVTAIEIFTCVMPESSAFFDLLETYNPKKRIKLN